MTTLQLAGPAQFIVPPFWTLTPPLTSDRTVYISSAGSDTTGDGTQANPWRQPARAWQDRKRFGELRAKYRLNAVGTGPFDWPVTMGASVCADNGYFIIAGDAAAQTTIATGTFTGDINTGLGNNCTAATTAGLGAVDGLVYDFVRITSGSYAGCIWQIVANTDASISFADVFARSIIGTSISGLTFEVFRPGSQMVVPSSTVTGPYGIQNWIGGGTLAGSQADGSPRHILFNLRFTGGSVRAESSQVCLVACRFEAGFNPVGSTIIGGLAPNGGILGLSGNVRNGFGYGAGYSVVDSTFTITSASMLRGVFSGRNASAWNWGASSYDQVNIFWDGGKIDAAITATKCYLGQSGAVFRRRIFNKTITMTRQCTMVLMDSTLFAVTAGSCVIARTGSMVIHQAGSSATGGCIGGTTDAAGFAFDIRNGGILAFELNQPLVTGGTLNNDIRMTSAAFPNTSFAAAGSVIGAAGDNARGELAYRL